MSTTNNKVLDDYDGLEVALEILSFAGGENTISEDQAMKTQEARVCENWESTSLGGMTRSAGITEVADGGVTYTDAPDLVIEHQDSGGKALYGIIEGDLVIKSTTTLAQEDSAAFTSGLLSHGVSAGGALWITNTTDNLQRKTFGNPIAAATGQPSQAYARIYQHKNRLVAEGSEDIQTRVEGSRVGVGNWNAADTWSLSNDAWSIDLPSATRGCVPNFPSGNEILVFTEDHTYALSNFPNTAYRPLGSTNRGCSAPYSIAYGDEGIYFVSRRPTLGVFLFDGVNFKELTEYNRDVFVEKINFSGRIFGVYKNKKYYLFYNEINSGVTYPNRCRVFDARFARWHNRVINSDLADELGYPCLLNYSSNELYVASSAKDKVYEMESGESDGGQDTDAVYKTKTFSSRDFAVASGGQFPVDDVRIKLTKLTATYYGTVGAIGVLVSCDRGTRSISKTLNLNATGDLINSTFTVNTSSIIQSPPDKTVTQTFSNNAIGKRFQIELTNSGTSTRPVLKKLKLTGVALEEE